MIRLDHAGHRSDADHARGTSAKAADVDTIYALKKRPDGKFVLAHNGNTRVPWMPQEVILKRETNPSLRHLLELEAPPAGTDDVVRTLDELGLPVAITVRKAVEELKRRSLGKSRDLVAAAVKLRKERLNVPENTTPADVRESSG